MHMKVHEITINKIEGEGNRYILVDGGGEPVIPVIKYLKYMDNIGRSVNTLRSYCYHLKLYFEYLVEKELSYESISIEDVAKFIGWLRTSHKSEKITTIRPINSVRSERTINTILTCVMSFYDFLDRLNMHENGLKEASTKKISSRNRNYKPFLHHISKNRLIDKNILKVKETKRQIKTLTQGEVQTIHDNCTNVRDELLMRILYEGGLRIGEAIGLEIEDFNIIKNTIRVKKSKTAAGENRIVFVSEETMNLFQDYLIDYHANEVDSNHVFIKLQGPNKGYPLSRNTVESMIKRIRKKTGIDFTPHMLRHTFASELHAKGVEISVIQKLLGHAQVQTTINTYVHINEDQLRESYTQAIKNRNTKKE